MKVSVLIPTYNRAAYLPEAINSVLNQSFRDFEVIIVDDGSTDNTPELVRGIRDPHVHYVRHLRNRGVAAALNTAWHAARGEYLARLDSDDVWRPELLEILVSALDADPGLGLIYARAQWMDTHGQLLPQMAGAPIKFPGETLKSLLYGDCVTPMAVVFRRECIERAGGYDESLIANEDWDLWIRMAEYCRFAYCTQVLAYYRIHPQNLTRGDSERSRRVIRDRLRVLEKFYARPDVPSAALAIKPLAFRNLYQDVALRHFTAGRWREALGYYVRAVRVAPNPFAAALRGVRDVLYHSSLGKTRWGVRLADAWVARQAKK
jgi:glycosyltransferase involved in cell wall biosynthesis